jgi:hypothetical protein
VPFRMNGQLEARGVELSHKVGRLREGFSSVGITTEYNRDKYTEFETRQTWRLSRARGESEK